MHNSEKSAAKIQIRIERGPLYLPALDPAGLVDAGVGLQDVVPIRRVQRELPLHRVVPHEHVRAWNEPKTFRNNLRSLQEPE